MNALITEAKEVFAEFVGVDTNLYDYKTVENPYDGCKFAVVFEHKKSLLRFAVVYNETDIKCNGDNVTSIGIEMLIKPYDERYDR